MSRESYHVKEREERALAERVRVGGLCRVISFDHKKMTVDVQPLSKVLDGGVYRTPPQVLGVPVAIIRGNKYVLRPWYQEGDMGVLHYVDHDIDFVKQSGEECQPNTERNHSDEDAIFIGAFVPNNNPVIEDIPDEAIVMAEEEKHFYFAMCHDKIKIVVGDSVIVITEKDVSIDTPKLYLNSGMAQK